MFQARFTAAALAVLLVGCGTAAAPPSQALTPLPATLRAQTPTLVAAPPALPTSSPVPPSPTAVPSPSSPTSSPVPPTATPVPPVPLRISALLDPATPHAGEDFTLALTIGNDGDRVAHGVYVATSGPWDQWTVLGVEPSGTTFDRDAAGWHLVNGTEVPPGETRTIEVHVRADRPAQQQLVFAVREASADELVALGN